MEFSGIVNDTSDSVKHTLDYILKLDIAPETKRELISKVLSRIGKHFGKKMFNDVSRLLGSTAIDSTIPFDENNQVSDLAQKIVRDSAFKLNDRPIIKEYYDVLLGRAEYSAFENAKSLEKHPTLTRTMTGRETCEWCRARTGTFTNPARELFQRHDNCDCIFKVSGYNSRNGTLKNYRKRKRPTSKTTTEERLARLSRKLKEYKEYSDTTKKIASVLEGDYMAVLADAKGRATKIFGVEPGTGIRITRPYAFHMDNAGHLTGYGFGKINRRDDYNPLTSKQLSSIPEIIQKANHSNTVFTGLRRGRLRYEIVSKGSGKGDRRLVVVETGKNRLGKQYIDIVTAYNITETKYQRKINEVKRILDSG